MSKSKEQVVAELKAKLDDLDNQSNKVAQDQRLVCDHLRELIGHEELLRWLKWRYERGRAEHEVAGQGWG